MSRFADIAAAHYATLRAARGYSAQIVRGEDQCEAVVTLARSESDAVTSREVRLSKDLQDVLIAVADYRPGYAGPASASVPRVGDQIIVNVSGETLTLEVRPRSASDMHCKHEDGQTKTEWRVYTKLVQREDVP